MKLKTLPKRLGSSVHSYNLWMFLTHLDLGDWVLLGASVKVTDEVTGKVCVSSGFMQMVPWAASHCNLHVDALKLTDKEIRLILKHISKQMIQVLTYFNSTAWIIFCGTPFMVFMTTLLMWMCRWAGTLEHTPLRSTVVWLEFCTTVSRNWKIL